MRHARSFERFFFSSRRRHTRFDCDWSSDVCSSDLAAHSEGSSASTSRLCARELNKFHAFARASVPSPAVPTWSLDRKSTRLNSSHSQISYAVFCLKKKNHITLLRWKLVTRKLRQYV